MGKGDNRPMDKVTNALKVGLSECKEFVEFTEVQIDPITERVVFTRQDLQDYIGVSEIHGKAKFQCETLYSELRIWDIEFLVIFVD
jgi:hypothetical protein